VRRLKALLAKIDPVPAVTPEAAGASARRSCVRVPVDRDHVPPD